MKILVFPQDPNPYQRLLYEEVERLGADSIYLGRLTPLHTLNVLLLPLEVLARRVGRARLVHLHWVFGFALPGGQRFRMVRRVAEAWFKVWLWTIRLLGVRLVWTAHNVLPHQPVFADDSAARRTLVAHSDLVIVHSSAALAELARLGAVPAKGVLIKHGPLSPSVPAASLRTPGHDDGPCRLLFFGKVEAYKGIEDLLIAFDLLPADTVASLTVAGACADPALRTRLQELASRCQKRVTLRLTHIPDEAVTPLLAEADAVVLPFRRVTTSGSAMLALAHGRPLIVPNIPALHDLPASAVTRYNGSVLGLAEAMSAITSAKGDDLAAMSVAARTYSEQTTWRDIAVQTMTEFIALLDVPSYASTQSRAAASS